MSKEAKIIKDLKERNERLNNQYMQEQARNYHLNYVIENDLEPRLKGYEYEIITLKSDFEAQHELTKKYAKENQQLKEQLDKATKQSVIDHKYASECEDRVITYKSVLDEIREYIETHVKEHIHDDYDVTLYNSLNQDECDELLQILDKAGSNE